jgi:hypothetical protein
MEHERFRQGSQPVLTPTEALALPQALTGLLELTGEEAKRIYYRGQSKVCRPNPQILRELLPQRSFGWTCSEVVSSYKPSFPSRR